MQTCLSSSAPKAPDPHAPMYTHMTKHMQTTITQQWPHTPTPICTLILNTKLAPTPFQAHIPLLSLLTSTLHLQHHTPHHAIPQTTREHHHTHWNLVEGPRSPHKVMKPDGRSWKVTECHRESQPEGDRRS